MARNRKSLIAKVFCAVSVCSLIYVAAVRLYYLGAPDFRSLGPNDRVEVEFASAGCFHKEQYHFTFKDGDPTKVTVTLTHAVGRKLPDPLVANLNVNDRDKSGLDALMRFCRSHRWSWSICTTKKMIQISWYRGSRKVYEETHTDGSCDWWDVPGALTFGSLADRALADRRRGAYEQILKSNEE